MGESGCGKSTCVSLLLRFYDVQEGQVLVDGVDVRDWDLSSLRHAMGLVMQEPTLFNYSIAENILYGQPQAYNSEIKAAASVANALEFIEASSAGLEVEESPEAMYEELKRNEASLLERMGKEEFKKAEKELDKMRKEQAKKGEFVAIEGDIDTRGPDRTDVKLHPGFRI